MKIVLEQEGNHLEMWVDDSNTTGIEWDIAIDDMAVELKDRKGVRRTAYNSWHWDLRRKQEAEEYITYFYLKHE